MTKNKVDYGTAANEYIKKASTVGLDTALYIYYYGILSAQTVYYTALGGVLRTKKESIIWKMKQLGLTAAQQSYYLTALGYSN